MNLIKPKIRKRIKICVKMPSVTNLLNKSTIKFESIVKTEDIKISKNFESTSDIQSFPRLHVRNVTDNLLKRSMTMTEKSRNSTENYKFFNKAISKRNDIYKPSLNIYTQRKFKPKSRLITYLGKRTFKEKPKSNINSILKLEALKYGHNIEREIGRAHV